MQELTSERSPSPNPSLTLALAIANYEEAIQTVKAVDPIPSIEMVLEILFARDCIESFLAADNTNVTAKALVQVIDLDNQLKSLSNVISNQKQVKNCRDSIKRPESYWWWFLSPPPELPPKLPGWASQDWLWNGLTVTCLVLSVGFVTNTLKAFSEDGLDLLQTFGAIGQGAGLVLVSGGALTDKGKKIVTDVLTNINVPPAYQAEVTFVFSAGILAATYGVNQSLPNLGNYYYNWGQEAYNKGELFIAEEKFKQAINFAPYDYRISTALGNIYETIENHDGAKSMYQDGFVAGHPEALNGMGRVWLRTAENNEELLRAETSFRLALSNSNLSPTLQSEIYAHLGLTLLKQASIDETDPEKVEAILDDAAQYLIQANEIDQSITANREVGLGMGYCYLAEVLERQGQTQESTEQWELCANRALPTSISEYQDVLVFGERSIADRLDPSKILSEGSEQSQN